jgi:uncharacterized protein involved in exopolysaccharide biosynthesis
MPRKRDKPERIAAKLRQVGILTSQVKRLKRNIATGPLDGGRSGAVRVLRQDNEENIDHIFTVLALLWRRSSTIAGICLVVVTIAALVTSLVQNRYTADAIIQVRLAGDNRQAQPGIAVNAVALNAASVIETETRLISSRIIAERVAARLELTNDTAFMSHKSPTERARDLFASIWRPAHDLFASVRPSFGKLPSRSAESLIADELMSNLKVTNDVKSYLIKISYTSHSPEQSARIANAFAQEYLHIRSVSRARQKLADLAATYGAKHPRILKTQAELDNGSRSTNINEDAQLLMPAEPIADPSSPNWRLILGLAFVGSLAVGIVVVLIQEHVAFRRQL